VRPLTDAARPAVAEADAWLAVRTARPQEDGPA